MNTTRETCFVVVFFLLPFQLFCFRRFYYTGELVEQNTAFKWCCYLIKRIMLFCIRLLSFWCVFRGAYLCAQEKNKDKGKGTHCIYLCYSVFTSLLLSPYKYLFKRALIFVLLSSSYCFFCQAHGILNSIDLDASVLFCLFSFFFLLFLNFSCVAYLKNWTGCDEPKFQTFHQSFNQTKQATNW